MCEFIIPISKNLEKKYWILRHTLFHACRYASEWMYKYKRQTCWKSILLPFQSTRNLIPQLLIQRWFHWRSHIDTLKSLPGKSQSSPYKTMLPISKGHYLAAYKLIRIYHRCHLSFWVLYCSVMDLVLPVLWNHQMNTIFGKSIWNKNTRNIVIKNAKSITHYGEKNMNFLQIHIKALEHDFIYMFCFHTASPDLISIVLYQCEIFKTHRLWKLSRVFRPVGLQTTLHSCGSKFIVIETT